ncbi:MAG: glycoside hydrolase family 9 protein [Bacteroidales bacterium]|nr:glycoside hydrolase family 9 protein [Bacteroidales bacterium]
MLKFWGLVILAAISASCNNPMAKNAVVEPMAYYNQVGYVADLPKLLLVTEGVALVLIQDHEGNEVFSAVPEPPLFWEQSGDAVRKVDFSAITKPGFYQVLLPNENESFEIHISERPFEELSKAVLRSFYYNRSGMAIEPQFGGQWARPAGHPDTIVYVHSSAADEYRPEGTIIASPFGWYDAGDYNKYIVNSGISTYTMFRALVDFKEFFGLLDANIPESGTGVPDLLSETMYNYRWMLSMQDPHDGGVYHKLTNKNFDGMVMPHEATNDRFVVSKTTAAALNFAAVAAQASRILSEYEIHFPGLSEESLEKAEKAWEWAVKNPDIPYVQPKDIQTGAYGDSHFDDEFFWAASELYLATGKHEYLDVLIDKYSKPMVPTWGQVSTLGFLSLLDEYDNLAESLKETGLKEDFMALVDQLVSVSQTAPYGVSIQEFAWGSNSQAANEGMLKLVAYRLTGNEAYFHSALSDLDYILGRNATGYCFVTGFGHKKVMNIHHRPSEADGIEEPVPGFLAGGPNVDVFTDCPKNVERSPFPAKSFVDLVCSYSTNEIAINWNAPLVYLVGGIEARHFKE